MSFIPGANVGPYRIVEQAERSGVATTYTAYQPSLGRYVTLVVVPAIDGDDSALLRQYQRQLELVLSLRHPNILTVIDHGEHLGVPFVVTETMEAEPLSDRLGAPWPLAEVVRVLRPIAAALDYAHGLGIVHGDVRPSSVLLTPDGTPLLAGFGLMTRPLAVPAGGRGGSSPGRGGPGPAGRPARPGADRLRDADRPDDGRGHRRLRAPPVAGPDRQPAAGGARRARPPPRADRRGERPLPERHRVRGRPVIAGRDDAHERRGALGARRRAAHRSSHRRPVRQSRRGFSPPADYRRPDLRGAGAARRARDPAAGRRCLPADRRAGPDARHGGHDARHERRGARGWRPGLGRAGGGCRPGRAGHWRRSGRRREPAGGRRGQRRPAQVQRQQAQARRASRPPLRRPPRAARPSRRLPRRHRRPARRRPRRPRRAPRRPAARRPGPGRRSR